MTHTVIGILDKGTVTDWIREDWNMRFNRYHNSNDYLWIQYKNGDIYCEQSGYSWHEDGDERPSLDVSKISYVHWWRSFPSGGGEAQVWINPKLGYEATMQILANFIGGHPTEIEVRNNFPYPIETWNIPEKNEYEEV